MSTLMLSPTLLLAVLACLCAAALGLNNGLARVPPMGFANWNGFGCNYNDTTIRSIADALVRTGMRDAGYTTIIIQECIVKAGARNASGVLQPDPEKFPYGMANLVDYIHSKGLKAGIYTDVGPETCAGYEGSFNHESIDARTFATWGIDFVEEDSCNHPPGLPYSQLYARMRDALNATGRPIVFYMCVQGQEDVEVWGPSTGNLWRTTGDICAPGQATWGGVMNNFYGNMRYPNVSGPGQWQDPDMLVVGMPGLTPLEWQSHFSLWAISAAPLWAGIDLTRMPPEAQAIFLNREVIAVDQDPLGRQGTRVPSSSSSAIAAAPQQRASLQPCSSAYAVSWAFNASNSSVRAEGQCLTVEACSIGPNGHIITYDCVGQQGGCPANQQFTLQRLPTGGVRLLSQISALCVAGAPETAHTGLTQQACDSVGTAWVLQPSGQIALDDNPLLCLSVGGPVSAAGEVWARPLASVQSGQKRVAAVLFNPDDAATQSIQFAFADVGLDGGQPVHVRDLWAHADLGTFTATFAATVPPHGVSMVLLEQ